MKSDQILWISIISILGRRCTFSNTGETDLVIGQTIDIALLIFQVSKNIQKDIHAVHYVHFKETDRLRQKEMEFILSHWKLKEQKEIVQELAKHINDSTLYIFTGGKKIGNVTVTEASRVASSEIRNYNATLYLSNSIRNQRMACYYYLSIDCGDGL